MCVILEKHCLKIDNRKLNMGAYLTFNFVEKNKEYIIGELPSLKMYEAKLSFVEKNYIKNGNSVSFKWGGYIFTEFEKKAHQWEYYSYGADCYFINLANILCSIDDSGYDDRTIYLYELNFVKNSIENVIKYAKLGGFSDNKAYEEDMKLLEYLDQILTDYKDRNFLVSCSIG